MILTNIETVPDKTIVEHFGVVSGSTVRAKHVGKDILASFKNIVGGELRAYTELLQEYRNQATERMIDQAKQLLKFFLHDGIIRGIRPDGELFEHESEMELSKKFLADLKLICLKGAIANGGNDKDCNL